MEGITIDFRESLLSTSDCETEGRVAQVELIWIATDVCGNATMKTVLANVVDETDPYSDDATWKGAALYLNYAVSERFGLGLRAERLEDPNGVRYFGPFEGNDFTLTGDVKLANGHFNVKPELRIDTAKNPYFEDADGSLKKSQMTLGAAFVYAFGSK